MRRCAMPRGFTLLEMIVAIGLVLAILGVSVRLIDDLGDAKMRTEARLRVVVGTSEFFDLLQARLDTATASGLDGGAGVFGDEVSLSVTGCGVRPYRLVDGSFGHPLQDRAAFEVRISGDALEVREDGGAWSPIVPDLVAIRFRYHDGSAWLDRWDGSAGLPTVVEVRVWTRPWTEGDVPDWIEVAEVFDETDRIDGVLLDDVDLRGFERREVSPEEAPAPDRIRLFAIPDANVSDGDVE